MKNLRIKKLLKEMQKMDIDGFLVNNPYNLRYFTKFTGTNGVAIITLNDNFFITDSRYIEQSYIEVQDFKIIESKNMILNEVSNICKKKKINFLAFESSYINFLEYNILKDLISKTILFPTSGIIERIREVKDQEEISIIRKSCNIADKAFDHILKKIYPGMSEIEVSNQLDFFMRSLGATKVSFDIIVGSGIRSCMPHAIASNKIIHKGEIVTLDFGCYYQGYVSDITRTFSIGNIPKRIQDIYYIVLKAQLETIKKAKRGIKGSDLDSIARDYINSFDYGINFNHATGHGIGLEVHEGPNISQKEKKTLVSGNVITIEPGIYLPSIGGVRIEDNILITEEGNELLTKSKKELIML